MRSQTRPVGLSVFIEILAFVQKIITCSKCCCSFPCDPAAGTLKRHYQSQFMALLMALSAHVWRSFKWIARHFKFVRSWIFLGKSDSKCFHKHILKYSKEKRVFLFCKSLNLCFVFLSCFSMKKSWVWVHITFISSSKGMEHLGVYLLELLLQQKALHIGFDWH